MKQTETYELNLIETSDPFLPEALNDNARKLAAEIARLDAADAAETARVDAALAALDRITPRFACGTYDGDGAASQLIELDFTPRIVLLSVDPGLSFTAIAMKGYPTKSGSETMLELVDNGFRVASGRTSYPFNAKDRIHRYLAIG